LTAESFKDGFKIQKEIFGDEFPQRAMDRTTPLTRPFQEFLVGFTFGEVWARPGLSRPERSLLTLAMLIALNRPEQIRNHVRGAINNGVTKEKLVELCIHAQAYCGAPLSVSAFATIVDELQKLGLEPVPSMPAVAPGVKS